MSQEHENMEAVRRFAEAFNARDEVGLAAWWWPDAELEENPSFVPDAGRYRGVDEITRYWRSYWKLWRDIRLDIQQIRTVGNSVIAVFAVPGAGRQSGAQVSTLFSCVARFAGGKAVSVTLYRHFAEALEAVGLPE